MLLSLIALLGTQNVKRLIKLSDLSIRDVAVVNSSNTDSDSTDHEVLKYRKKPSAVFCERTFEVEERM